MSRDKNKRFNLPFERAIHSAPGYSVRIRTSNNWNIFYNAWSVFAASTVILFGKKMHYPLLQTKLLNYSYYNIIEFEKRHIGLFFYSSARDKRKILNTIRAASYRIFILKKRIVYLITAVDMKTAIKVKLSFLHQILLYETYKTRTLEKQLNK